MWYRDCRKGDIRTLSVSRPWAALDEMQQRDNHFVKYTAPDSRSFHHLMTVQMERGDAGRVLELASEMRMLAWLTSSASATSPRRFCTNLCCALDELPTLALLSATWPDA